MDEILTFLSQGWVGTIIGIAGILVAIIVTAYYYHKS